MQEKLIKLLNNSYSPYSKFAVSAIVVMKDGKEFGGVNVENASYGATVCAERCAILKAVSEGYKVGDFKELNLMISNGKIGTPCGLCRQIISEFFEEDGVVNCYSTEGKIKKIKVSELFPYSFSKEDL